MAAFTGEKNTKFFDAFNNNVRLSNYTRRISIFEAEQNVFDNVFIYDILNTPIPVVEDNAEINTIFKTAFASLPNFNPETFVEFLIVDYKGEQNHLFQNFFNNDFRFGNYIARPIEPEGGQENTYFTNIFENSPKLVFSSFHRPVLKTKGQFWPKVTGGHRYGGTW